MSLALSPADLPPRWSSLEKEDSATGEQQGMNGPSSPASDGYYDSGEEKVAVAPNMAVITKAIRQKKSRMYLDERYMSSEEALSLSPPGEELHLTDDGEDTYDVDDLLEDIFEGEERLEYQHSPQHSFVDLAVALSITPMGRAKMIAIDSPSSPSLSDKEDDETLRRLSKASKRDVPFIAVPKRLRPLSIVKPIEILDDGSQSAASPDFWTAVPMFGTAIIPPRSDSIPSVSQTATDTSASQSTTSASSPSVTDTSSQFSRAESNTTASDSPPIGRRPSTTSLFQKEQSATHKGPSLFKSIGSKFSTLARKPKMDSLAQASNGLAACTMSTGAAAAPAFNRTNSISHRRRDSLGRLAGRTLSALNTTGDAADGDRSGAGRPKLEARGASERAPMLELPPFPDDIEFRIEADEEVMAISKQLTRRPVAARTAQQLQKEEREVKRRSLLGLGRRSNESARGTN